MLGGDFETVHGEWGHPREVAAFVDDSFTEPERAGCSWTAARSRGASGVDRTAGDFRVSGNAAAVATVRRRRARRRISIRAT